MITTNIQSYFILFLICFIIIYLDRKYNNIYKYKKNIYNNIFISSSIYTTIIFLFYNIINNYNDNNNDLYILSDVPNF